MRKTRANFYKYKKKIFTKELLKYIKITKILNSILKILNCKAIIQIKKYLHEK